MALCWKCREYFQNKYGSSYYQPPSSHCHHDEPEEKPKEKCICETIDSPFIIECKILRNGLPYLIGNAKFCPKCSKKLEGT